MHETSMKNRPKIKEGDWIVVENCNCVVAHVYEPDSSFGDCEVVFNKKKPTNRDVKWNGEKWMFKDSGDFGGYANRSQRLKMYIGILKYGKTTPVTR